MLKSELKTGMIVTNGYGDEFMVYRNVTTEQVSGDFFVMIRTHEAFCENMSNYTDDLKYVDDFDQKQDIVKIEILRHPECFAQPIAKTKNRKVLWERSEAVR